MTDHKSDCATHNEPAMPNGPCDCGAVIIERVARALCKVDMEPVEYTVLATAAVLATLAAIREPTPGMMEAPSKRGQIGPMGACEVWQAMIDQLRAEFNAAGKSDD